MRFLVFLLYITGFSGIAQGQALPASPAPLVPPAQKQQAPADLPDNVLALRQLAGEYYYTGNHAEFVRVMEKLHDLRPNNGEYMYQLTIAYSLANEPGKAYNRMLLMQQQGLSYDYTKNEDFENIRGTQVFDYLSDLMVRAGEPIGNGSVAFKLPEDFILPEAIDWDAGREQFIIGNIDDGRVLLVDRDGKTSPFIESDPDNGPWGVFDLKVDAGRNLLWISSAAGSAYRLASDEVRNKTGLFKFELSSGKLLGTYLVPDTDKRRSALANIALASDGTVYVADSLRPVIYKLQDGDGALAPLFVSSKLISVRGMALSEDNKTLYMADYELGIVVLRLEQQQAIALVVPENLNVGGIDGLYLWKNHLVAIQNGISPQRVMRLELDASGTRVENVRPLEIAHPAFDAPNYGTVVGEDLYYFGNSQWHKIGRDGSLADKTPVSVLKTSLLGQSDLQTPEMDKIMEQIRQRQGINPVQVRPGLLDANPDEKEN